MIIIWQNIILPQCKRKINILALTIIFSASVSYKLFFLFNGWHLWYLSRYVEVEPLQGIRAKQPEGVIALSAKGDRPRVALSYGGRVRGVVEQLLDFLVVDSAGQQVGIFAVLFAHGAHGLATEVCNGPLASSLWQGPQTLVRKLVTFSQSQELCDTAGRG